MRLRRKEHGFDAAVLGLVSSSLRPDAAEPPAVPATAKQARPAVRAGGRRAGCEADLDAAVLNALFDSTPPPARRQTRYESATSSEAEDTRGAYDTSIRSVGNARREGSPSRERETAMRTRGSSRIEPAGLPCTAPYSDKAPPTHSQYLPRDLQRAHPPSRAAGAGAVPSQSTSAAALAPHGGSSGVTFSGHSRAGGGPEAVDHGSESLWSPGAARDDVTNRKGRDRHLDQNMAEALTTGKGSDGHARLAGAEGASLLHFFQVTTQNACTEAAREGRGGAVETARSTAQTTRSQLSAAGSDDPLALIASSLASSFESGFEAAAQQLDALETVVRDLARDPPAGRLREGEGGGGGGRHSYADLLVKARLAVDQDTPDPVREGAEAGGSNAAVPPAPMPLSAKALPSNRTEGAQAKGPVGLLEAAQQQAAEAARAWAAAAELESARSQARFDQQLVLLNRNRRNFSLRRGGGDGGGGDGGGGRGAALGAEAGGGDAAANKRVDMAKWGGRDLSKRGLVDDWFEGQMKGQSASSIPAAGAGRARERGDAKTKTKTAASAADANQTLVS